MEPITIFTVAIHQAILALVSRKARQDEVPISSEPASVVIDGARAFCVGISFALPSTVSNTLATVSLNPLIDLGKSTLEVACDIARDTQARSQFNTKIASYLRTDGYIGSNSAWVCPRSKRAIDIDIEGNGFRVSCLYLLQRPPLGCKVTWKKLGLLQLAFPPLIPLSIMKATFDFTLHSIGLPYWKTYGYCCLADKIIHGVTSYGT
ncbi:hypothetical protein ES705_41421 [subsurface metagenome]